MADFLDVSDAMEISIENIFSKLPTMGSFEKNIRRAPKRDFTLSHEDTVLSLKNALHRIVNGGRAHSVKRGVLNATRAPVGTQCHSTKPMATAQKK